MVRSRDRAWRHPAASTPPPPRRCRACSASIPPPTLTGYGGLKCNLPLKSRDGSPIKYTPRPALADRQGALRRRSDRLRGRRDHRAGQGRGRSGRARHRAAARRDRARATPHKPGAPQLYDEVPNNIALDYHYGDSDKVAAAFAKAAHVAKLPLVNQRLVVDCDRAALRHRRIRRRQMTSGRCIRAARACSA